MLVVSVLFVSEEFDTVVVLAVELLSVLLVVELSEVDEDKSESDAKLVRRICLLIPNSFVLYSSIIGSTRLSLLKNFWLA